MIVLNVFIELNKGVHIWAMVIILIPPPHQIDFVSLRTRSPFRYFLTMLPFSLTVLNVLSKVWLLFCTYPSSHKNVILEFFFVAKEIFWYVLYLSPHIVVIFIYSLWNLLNGLSTYLTEHNNKNTTLKIIWTLHFHSKRPHG